jgi:Domain of unknown function (DUF1990)
MRALKSLPPVSHRFHHPSPSMKIYLFDQTKKFTKHLAFFKSKPVMPYDRSLLPENVTTVVVHTNLRLDQLDLGFLFDYQIFPERILNYCTQWASENRSMRIGDTIAQQTFVPPVKWLSQKIVFGVRIQAIIDEPDRKGFSYETLEGHAEKGISTFTVEQSQGKIIFKIHTYSAPGNLLSRLMGPIFTRPYQAYCTKAAVNRVRQQLEMQAL